MKPIIRLPIKQYEMLEVIAQTTCTIHEKQGMNLLQEGYQCLEGPRFIFIHAKEPPRGDPEIPHWYSAFRHQVILDATLHKKKDRYFLQIKLKLKEA